MKIEDRRGDKTWSIKHRNTTCPHLYYPNVIIGCRLKEDTENPYCEEATCPLKVKP